MVAFDDLSRDVEALDAVGVDSALAEPLRVSDFLCLGVEHLDEIASDDFPLLFGVGHSVEVGEEASAGIHADDVQAEALVVLHHVLELVLAQHAMVHEDAGQSVADGAVEQDGADAAVHASRQSEYDAVVAYLFPQLGNGRLHEVGSRPVLPAAADIDHEIPQELRSLQRVVHLRMELDAPDRL